MTILSVAPDDGGRRLDRVIRKALPELPLSLIHRLLRTGKVLVDGRPRDAAFHVEAGQQIGLPAPARKVPDLPDLVPALGPVPVKAGPRGARPPRIIYESPDFLVLDKEAGREVHGSGESLDSLVRAYLSPGLPPSLSFRPGPLHRLDRPTSGLVVFSASLRGARYFSALLREGKVRKQYLALVEGGVTGPGLWEDLLLRDREARRTAPSAEGKPARTRFTPLARRDGGESAGRAYSLLVLEPETGRTHQIRAQAGARGHPLAGDSKYGGRPLGQNGGPLKQNGGLPKQNGGPPFLLHAWKIIPPAPAENDPGLPAAAGTAFREDAAPLLPPLTAPPPEYFRAAVENIFGAGVLRRLEDW
jgi:23S rRNA pseudouridine955/2504/2580 synthase